LKHQHKNWIRIRKECERIRKISKEFERIRKNSKEFERIRKEFRITLDSLRLCQDSVGYFEPLFTNATPLFTASITGNATLVKYGGSFYAFAVRWNHGEDTDSRLISGIDLRGTTAMCQFTIKATGGPAVFPIVFAKCKSSLSVGKYRQLSVGL
jgi:hypothetical protein